MRRLIEAGAFPSSHATNLPDEPFLANVRGERAFRAAVDAGKSLPLEQAIALAHDA